MEPVPIVRVWFQLPYSHKIQAHTDIRNRMIRGNDMPCKVLLSLIAALLLAACATTSPPDPSLFNDTEAAIQRAVNAGAEQSAPVELRFARERLEFVKNTAMPNEDYELASWRLAEAQLDAQLAYVKAQTFMARESEAAAKAEVDRLRANIIDAYGADALPGELQ